MAGGTTVVVTVGAAGAGEVEGEEGEGDCRGADLLSSLTALMNEFGCGCGCACI